MASLDGGITHLDLDNEAPFLTDETLQFLSRPQDFQLVSAHAYIGARGIKRALAEGCDIIICG
jgi:hypothetical protein